jgi:demethylmenaquinone methyltransferase/2-methoxy-6-polyprenyl-1,4-benzoquinol methylase
MEPGVSTAEVPPEKGAPGQPDGGEAGTRPEGTSDEREARAWVRATFSRIAPRYDFLNHFLSLSLDRVWRRKTARRFRHILSRPDARVLDLCCGTGDLAFALARQAQREGAMQARVWGADFAHPMLQLAQRKTAAGARVEFLEADALQLPFAGNCFDLVTAAFGFRNLANYDAGLREILRVLRPEGEAGILEFAVPRLWLMAQLYRMYFTQVLPRVGGAISGNSNAYRYLPGSVSKFPEPAALVERMKQLGFRQASVEAWTLGIVALYRGTK